MTEGKKRDNDYFLHRLRTEHPAVHADLEAGKYPSVAAALRAAGITKKRTRLQELNNAWNKASQAEREAFLRNRGLTAAAPGPTSAGGPVAIDSRLTHWGHQQVRKIMTSRGMTIGHVMRELGLNSRDTSLGMALARDTRLRPDAILRLEKWIKANAKH